MENDNLSSLARVRSHSCVYIEYLLLVNLLWLLVFFHFPLDRTNFLVFDTLASFLFFGVSVRESSISFQSTSEVQHFLVDSKLTNFLAQLPADVHSYECCQHGFQAGDQLIFKAEARSAEKVHGKQRTKFCAGFDRDHLE